MNGKKLWPALHFGPVNLWTVMSALMFYSTHDEQEKIVWREYDQVIHATRTKAIVPDSPAIGRIGMLIAAR